jgi:superfamily II DNA helicase RecQ
VCVNNDDVQPINSISIDPTFFGLMDSREGLAEFRSTNESMCYLLISLDDEDGRAYCISQGKQLRINNRDVQASDIQDALQFVSTKDISTDGVVCSSCLYKYLVTLSSVFSDMLSQAEKSDAIRAYVKRTAVKMAMNLEKAPKEEDLKDEEALQRHLRKHITDLVRLKSELASLTLEVKTRGEDEDLLNLCEQYRLLTRLYTVFLFQVLTLTEAEDEPVALGALKFMLGVAGRAVELNNRIREKTHQLEESSKIPEWARPQLEKHATVRKRNEQGILNLARVLSQV